MVVIMKNNCAHHPKTNIVIVVDNRAHHPKKQQFLIVVVIKNNRARLPNKNKTCDSSTDLK